MRVERWSALMLVTAVSAGAAVVSGTGQTPAPPQGVLLEPLGQAGEAVYPAFEGFGPTKDGTQQVLLLGYFNRNKQQELDIPIGANNRIEPGGPDYGQPTHFHLGRQYGVFAKYRGPGEVKVADEVLALFNEGDAKRFVEAKTTATFSAPGEYWLRAQVNDSSGDGGGGDQCCWTTAHVRVNVR